MSVADKLTTIAENVPKVYEAGKKAEYDAFWDTFQDYGNRTNYSGLFAGIEVDVKEWFKPKYDIVPTRMYMFTYLGTAVANVDFVEWFEELGIKLDTSKCTNFQYAFQNGARYGTIDTSSASSLQSQFFWNNTKVHTIEKLIVHESLTFANMNFQYCSSLKHMIVCGTIGKTGLNLQWSTKLDKESIESVINALSATTSGLTVTLSSAAVTAAFGSTASEEWQTLIGTKPNWTISLA